jgi:hypothetical protein
MRGPLAFGGVPVADEKAKMERDERWPYEKFGLKEEYMCKRDKTHGLPIPSKNPEDYDIPVNAPIPLELVTGRPNAEVNMRAKKQLAAAAWEEYKRRFMEKGLIGYNGKSVARALNFSNNAAAVEEGEAGEAGEAEGAEAGNNSGVSPKALAFRKSRKGKSRRQRRQKKTRRQRK